MSTIHSAYYACRPFHFPGKTFRSVGTRSANFEDAESLATLARNAQAHGAAGGGGSEIYEMCWENGYNPQESYRKYFEASMKDQRKRLYIVEDTAPTRELLAVIIVVLEHNHIKTDPLSIDPNNNTPAERVKWESLQYELSKLRTKIRTNMHVHIEGMFIKPQYSFIRTTDSDNPDPFLAKALFNFVYSLAESSNRAAAITALVPESGLWMYEKLGFERTEETDYRLRLLCGRRGIGDQYDDDESPNLLLKLMVWRRRRDYRINFTEF